MNVEWRLVAGLGAFLAPWAALYWFTSYEHAGSVMLAGSVAMFLFLGAYILTLARRTAPRPEDRSDASPNEDEEDLGFFPSASVWPFVIGVAAVMIAYGLVFSRWVAFPGLLLIVTAAVGYAREAQARP